MPSVPTISRPPRLQKLTVGWLATRLPTTTISSVRSFVLADVESPGFATPHPNPIHASAAPPHDHPRVWTLACNMEMEDMSLEVAERDTAAEIAAEAAVTTTSATAAMPTPDLDHDHDHYRPSHHRHHHHHHARGSSSSGANPPVSSGDAAHRRTCQPCRLRKVKCIAGDGLACANCERLGFTCSFAGSSPQADGDGAGSAFSLPRRRVRLACSSCHSRKARCSGDTPKCKRCQSQGLECVYRPTKRSGGPGPGPGPGGEGASATTTPPGHAGDSEHESAASEPPEKRRHVRDDRVPGHAKSHSLSHGQGSYGPWALNHEP